ncbi:MAG TPA: VacB/RNase II family 3'-5' exoribonuclease [Candidatus Acidoferrum sp.]|nr:VacB/RNase II family 3'-5' exoribonuclease [Candidatus Acidoferrum sp.]
MKRNPKRSKPTAEPQVTPAQVIAHLATLSKPASIREIAHGLGLKHSGRRFLPRVIQQLERKAEIEEHGNRYRLASQRISKPPETAHARPAQSDSRERPHTQIEHAPKTPQRAHDPNLAAGRMVAHRDGYGFVVPDAPIPGIDGDLFIPRDNMNDAMHGDRVLARVAHRRPDGRAEGRVVQILEREHPTIVGLFRYGPHGNHVLPYDVRIHHEVFIPAGQELTPELLQKIGTSTNDTAAARTRLPELDGAVVNVQITRFPRGGLAPAGRVVEIIGRPGEIGVDTEIIIRKHHLPHVFSDEALKEARATPQQVSEHDLRERRDFRRVPIVTIDGETARDFDDAVHVSRRADGGYELQVHIADVAHYVRAGSALDREARVRGTSVYFPNRAVPMLPEELSNGICSLNPHVDRLVMSVLMEMDPSGKTISTDFTPGVIRSAERMTYTNVHKVLERDPEMTERYAHLVDNFRLMKELALLLNRRRNERGSIDFDLPEPVIEFDESGRMMSIVRSVRNIAHRIIEEFMLAANEAVARYLDGRGIATLHRVHEKPDPKKVIEFEELAHAFGYSLGVEDLSERRVTVRHGRVQPPARDTRHGRTAQGRARQMSVTLPASEEVDIRPQHYQRLTEKIAGKPEERILSYLMLRSLKQARYAADPLGHFALAADEYTHFTSPIRRYPDLIVHRTLKWALENPSAKPHLAPSRARSSAKDGEPAMVGPYKRVELEEIAAETSESERAAEAAERELMDWKTAQFMESRLGDEFDGLIISVQKFGFFVELVELFVEGLVSIDHLEQATGQRAVYRERDHAIVTEPHRGARGNAQRHTFSLGDRIRVRADRIDPLRHKVEFALA